MSARREERGVHRHTSFEEEEKKRRREEEKRRKKLRSPVSSEYIQNENNK